MFSGKKNQKNYNQRCLPISINLDNLKVKLNFICFTITKISLQKSRRDSTKLLHFLFFEVPKNLTSSEYYNERSLFKVLITE